jgi:hypothetical protein
MDAIVTAIVGGLLILVIGWLKLDINRLADKIDRLDTVLSGRIDRVESRIDHLAEHLGERIDSVGERIARLEGRMDERERQP